MNLKRIEEEEQTLRTIMKYRLYGIDGVSDRELQKLVQIEVIKKRHHEDQ